MELMDIDWVKIGAQGGPVSPLAWVNHVHSNLEI